MIEQVHMTVYAGDWEHKHLIIVGKDSYDILELPSHPFCGILMKDDTLLCVG